MTLLLRRFSAGAFLAAAWIGSAMAADNIARYHVGETERLFHPPLARHWRGAKTEGLTAIIWYPVAQNTSEGAHDIGPPGHPIFRGHAVAVDAQPSPAQARYPLLLLSHGTGGSADSLDWLGAALAAAGYVVVGVNHPGNNALEPLTREGFMLWWERATDLSEALDGILTDPMLGPHIDQSRIAAVGFSLGGYTVLELAGAKTNLQAFENFCHSPAADVACHPPEMAQIRDDADPRAVPSAETTASLARAGASYRDTRVKAVLAIAPALGQAFDAASFADVEIPVWLLAGTSDDTVPVETNIKRIAGLMPTAGITMLPGASHYTFIDVCAPAMAERSPGLCKDNPGIDREAIHAQTIERAIAFLTKTVAATD